MTASLRKPRHYDRRQWRDRTSKFVLANEPLCRRCREEGRATPATEVNHILPIRKGGSDDLENLEPICLRHHRIVTANGG